MRAVGQDMVTAESAGINVNKTRIYAIIVSTVLACYGQVIYLQNMTTLQTYNGADQVGLYAAAAILVGGASIKKASISNAIIGTALFHLMFIVMPTAGKNLTGQALMGEYLQKFISYGAITAALILHELSRRRESNYQRSNLRLGK